MKRTDAAVRIVFAMLLCLPFASCSTNVQQVRVERATLVSYPKYNTPQEEVEVRKALPVTDAEEVQISDDEPEITANNPDVNKVIFVPGMKLADLPHDDLAILPKSEPSKPLAYSVPTPNDILVTEGVITNLWDSGNIFPHQTDYVQIPVRAAYDFSEPAIIQIPPVSIPAAVKSVAVNYKGGIKIPTLEDVETILPADVSLLYLFDYKSTGNEKVQVEETASFPWKLIRILAVIAVSIIILVLLFIVLMFLFRRFKNRKPKSDRAIDIPARIKLEADLEKSKKEYAALALAIDEENRREEEAAARELENREFERIDAARQAVMENRKKEILEDKEKRKEKRVARKEKLLNSFLVVWISKQITLVPLYIKKRIVSYQRGKRLKQLMAPRLEARKEREKEKARVDAEFKKKYPQGGPRLKTSTLETPTPSPSTIGREEGVGTPKELGTAQFEVVVMPIPKSVLHGAKSLSDLSQFLKLPDFTSGRLPSRKNPSRNLSVDQLISQIDAIIRLISEGKKPRVKHYNEEKKRWMKKLEEAIDNLPITDIDPATKNEWLQKWVLDQVLKQTKVLGYDFDKTLPMLEGHRDDHQASA